MQKINIIALLLVLLILLISGYAIAGGASINETVTIKPSKSYEDCIEVLPGQRMHVSFNSSNFVNFNIHYHAEGGLYYPVNKKGVMIWKGSLDPQKLDYYTEDQESLCVMWDNPDSEPVKISFSVKAKSAQ